MANEKQQERRYRYGPGAPCVDEIERDAKEKQERIQGQGGAKRFESREVLAGAYVSGLPHNMLLHAVEVDSDGRELRVLCKKVKLDSLADAGSGNPSAPPTCKACRAALRKAGRE